MAWADDELVNYIMHIANMAAKSFPPFLYAHISDYDPETHMVRVMIPALRGANNAPFLSGWIPFQSAWVGSGWGVQFAPLGGASYENPDAGELVLVQVLDSDDGAYMVAQPYFTNKMLPPLVSIQAGEGIIQHKSGTYIYLKNTGDLAIQTNNDCNVTANKDCNITAKSSCNVNTTSNVSVTAGGNISLTANGGAITSKATTWTHTGSFVASGDISDNSGNSGTLSQFRTNYNNHLHTGVTTGSGDTGTTTDPAG